MRVSYIIASISCLALGINAAHAADSGAMTGVEKTRSQRTGDRRLLIAAKQEISVSARDLPGLTLYPSAIYYDKGTTTHPLGTAGRGTTNQVKFVTRDSVSKVYAYYVADLKRRGYTFMRGGSKSGFKAQNFKLKTIVSVQYIPLDDPKEGTIVGVAICRATGSAPTDIGFGVSKWNVPQDVLKRVTGH